MDRPRTSLERAVLSTLSYFDIFDYPLRVEEVWRWLYVADDRDHEPVRSADPHAVELTVRELERTGEVERTGELLSLRDRSNIVGIRAQRHAVNHKLWGRARFVSSLLRLVPFVRFVGVVNTLAFDNARPDSDIDLFVIVRRGRLWQTRLVVTALTQLFGIRRHGHSIAGRVCLSFFLSDRALSLEDLKIESEDPYLAFWTMGVVPMFDRSGTWMRFVRENGWTKRRLPNADAVLATAYHADSWLPGIFRSFGEIMLGTWLGDGLEFVSRWPQRLKMNFSTVPDELRGESSVIVNDDILKFHERDRRQEYGHAFFKRMKEVL